MEPQSPYSPPEIGAPPTAAELERKKSFWRRTIKNSIALIVIPPLLGIALAMRNMVKAFQTAGDGGTIDRVALATDVGHALTATSIGMVVSFFGLVLLTISLIRFFSYRASIRKLPA